MDPTLRERLAAMVAAYDEMCAAPDRLDAGPMWQAAHERYCDLVRKAPGGHLGIERLALELDAEVQRLKANEAAREGVLRRTTDQLRAHQDFMVDTCRLIVADRLTPDSLADQLEGLRERLATLPRP